MVATTIVPRGGARVLLVAGAVAVAALVALSAWLLRPAGESSPPGNGWVPGAGSVEWMRIERARPGTTPLADLNSLDPGALPVMEMVLGWLREAPVVAGAPAEALLPNGDILRMRVGEGRVITVSRAQDCVPRPDLVVGAPWVCGPAPGFVSVADETGGGGSVVRLDAPALDAWLDTGWQGDVLPGRREPHPGGIPVPGDLARATLTSGMPLDTPPAFEADGDGAAELAKLLGWLAEGTLVGAEPEWSMPRVGGLVFEERDGRTTTVTLAYDCAVTRGAAGEVGASSCPASREFVVLTPSPGRGEPGRVWSPALAGWLGGR